MGLLVHLLFNGVGTGELLLPHFFMFGLLRRNDVNEDRWVVFTRVSSDSQLGNTSTETQLTDLENEVNRMEGEIVETFEGAESAATMDRDSANRIVNMAENDRFDILGVWKLDRLTRAKPWESIDYLRRIKESGVLLYAGTHGYFDWEELYDLKMIYNQVAFAREWYERIKENAEEGQISYLEEGKWPFGEPHFGYVKDESDNLNLTDQGREIIPRIFNTYIRTENRAETRKQINSVDEIQYEGLSDNQIKTVLESELCIGHLALKGEVIQKSMRLKAVEKETYRRVQDLLNARRPSRTAIDGVPDPINRAAHRFGPEFAIEHLDTMSRQCPKCSGEINPYGTTTRWGQKTKNYHCKECNWQGPLLSEREFKQVHGTHPLRCPYCTTTEGFEVTKSSTGRYKYEYTCVVCDNSFGTDQLPNKYKRAFENPDLKFEFDRQHDSACDSGSKTAEDTEDDPDQYQLTAF